LALEVITIFFDCFFILSDLSELKKQTDKRRMELAEKATRYNTPVEESLEKKEK
jgi:hypothetical protein